MGGDAQVALRGVGVSREQVHVDVQDLHCLRAAHITGIGLQEAVQG
jgi:hypothetical protein